MVKYYAVVVGRKPGIYTDWNTTKAMTQGYPKAVYKGFATKAEAENFMNAASQNVVQAGNNTDNYYQIYTDGSYTGNSSGFGIVFFESPNTKYTAYGKVPLPPTNNVAELYAIYTALSLVQADVVINTDSQYAIATLTSYMHGWSESDWEKASNKELLKGINELMKNRKVVFKHVAAHTGIELNEEADQLANMGRVSKENLILLKNGERIR